MPFFCKWKTTPVFMLRLEASIPSLVCLSVCLQKKIVTKLFLQKIENKMNFDVFKNFKNILERI